MNPNVKRHLISALVTFLTAFGLVLVADIDSITLDSLRSDATLGLIFAAGRAGVKAVIEFFLRR